MDRSERSALIQKYYFLEDEHLRLYKENASEVQLEALRASIIATKQDYFDRLPRCTLSRCPFSKLPLVSAFDPWGLDGLWWHEKEKRKTPEPTPPSAFRLLRGAVHFSGLPPNGGRKEAIVGPEVPYVIPRILLQFPDMVAVISCVRLECGYTSYPIAYYSTTRPPLGSLAQTWRYSTYNWGNGSWSMPADPWDFDLKPWVEQGRVLWIDPEDREFTVRRGDWAEFPYGDLPGKREQQIVCGTQLFTEPPPNNEVFEPFE